METLVLPSVRRKRSKKELVTFTHEDSRWQPSAGKFLMELLILLGSTFSEPLIYSYFSRTECTDLVYSTPLLEEQAWLGRHNSPGDSLLSGVRGKSRVFQHAFLKVFENTVDYISHSTFSPLSSALLFLLDWIVGSMLN